MSTTTTDEQIQKYVKAAEQRKKYYKSYYAANKSKYKATDPLQHTIKTYGEISDEEIALFGNDINKYCKCKQLMAFLKTTYGEQFDDLLKK